MISNQVINGKKKNQEEQLQAFQLLENKNLNSTAYMHNQ